MLRPALLFLTAALFLAGSGSALANPFTSLWNSLFGDGQVTTVKEAVLPQYSKTVTLGDALENYSDCAEDTVVWQSLEDRGRNLVEFSCRLTKSPSVISSNRANPLMLGLLKASSFFTGRKAPELSSEAMQAYFKFERITLAVRFAMSKLDESAFETDSVLLNVNFSDGQRGQIRLDGDPLRRVYADTPMTDFDNAEDFASFLQDLVEIHDADVSSGDTI